MDILEKKILRCLERHGVLSQTGFYRYFHRYRAAKKNAAVNNLLKAGLICKEVRRLNINARKPTQLFALSAAGTKYLQENNLIFAQTKSFT